uniref:FH2 domain-containing protein n=1 Tax=Myripristis murdjan TaxID=586833 RepID=A0A667ZFR5_9TELE
MITDAFAPPPPRTIASAWWTTWCHITCTIMFPLPEPQDVFLAAQAKFADLSKDLRQLGRDLTVCEKGVQRVCSDSPEEHLQPFKDKMESYIVQCFQELVLYFGLKPKTGEKEVATGYFFMLWFEFCTDFKTRWKKENKNISKERYHTTGKQVAQKKKKKKLNN